MRVSVFSRMIFDIFFFREQDRTHPPEYYKPEYDVLEDHGTVGGFNYATGHFIDLFRVTVQLATKTAWWFHLRPPST